MNTSKSKQYRPNPLYCKTLLFMVPITQQAVIYTNDVLVFTYICI